MVFYCEKILYLRKHRIAEVGVISGDYTGPCPAQSKVI